MEPDPKPAFTLLRVPIVIEKRKKMWIRRIWEFQFSTMNNTTDTNNFKNFINSVTLFKSAMFLYNLITQMHCMRLDNILKLKLVCRKLSL